LPDSPAGDRSVAWITLRVDDQILSDLGSPALQIATST
jgi:hypothetical protein